MSEAKNPATKPAASPAAASNEEAKPEAKPIWAKPLLAALASAKPALGLDVQSSALLLAILVVSKGKAWAREVAPDQLVEEARNFAHGNPIAWHAMLRGNVMGMARGLVINGIDTVPVEEYSRLASEFSAAA